MTATGQSSAQDDVQLLPLGQGGIVVRFGTVLSEELSQQVLGFHRALLADLPEGVEEVAPSLGSVLVRFDPGLTGRATLERALRARLAAGWPDQAHVRRRIWHLPVCFAPDQAPDLASFAALSGLSQAQLVDQAIRADLQVLALGFAPGQPYLGYLPPAWDVPRKSDLTPKVPQGALVAALRQLVLFNNASATGWHQIGETGFRPFQLQRDQPFALEPGDGLRLHAVGAAEYDGLRESTDGLGGARCEVLA